MTFGAHNLVRSEPFLDSRCELCCQRLTNLYKYTSMFSALNYCGGIFWKLSAIYTKWCTQIFPPIFGLFAIFDRNFANVVAPSSEENENFVVHRKARSLLKKVKIASKSTHKPRRNTCSNYAPLERRASRPGSVTNKKTRSSADADKPVRRT